MKKLVIAIVAMFALALGASAAGWSHGQYSPGSYSSSVTVPALAQVTQTLQAFNIYDGSGHPIQFGEAANSGPLGSYSTMAGPQQYYQGSAGAGTYYVSQTVLVSGYSVTVITW